MATRFSSALRADSLVAANIQGWAQFFEDTLVTTGGWVVTADTGQTLPASLAAASGTSQKKGYRIYRMNDALQATSPIYMRIDYGSAQTSPPAAGLWVTIGTGSDGSGNITGLLWNGGSLANPNVMSSGTGSSAAAIPTNSYGSAGTNRFSVGLFIQTTNAAVPLVFTLERTKDALGNDTGDGVLLLYTSATGAAGQAPINVSRYLISQVGPQPRPEDGLSYALTRNNPSDTVGGSIGVGMPIHFKGLAQQPGTNCAIVNSADVAAEGAFSIILYGAIRTYRQLSVVLANKTKSGTGSIVDTNVRSCIRYD